VKSEQHSAAGFITPADRITARWNNVTLSESNKYWKQLRLLLLLLLLLLVVVVVIVAAAVAVGIL
jgi:hypothetical protein